MPLKPCLGGPDGEQCGVLSDQARCPIHRSQRNRQRDQRRGKTAARDYGGLHQQERARWQVRMNRGEVVNCWRCGDPVDPTDWHLGHSNDRRRREGPEHPLCNLAAAGHASHQ